eukprot:GEZU01043156.1.p1 GENE.GEZU01043156.1~~GEZU01043156.1.p1  ORF type:complete len:324 (-),score=86.96 GEZU01043156.1:76-942(-)
MMFADVITVSLEYEGEKKTLKIDRRASNELLVQRIRCLFPALLHRTLHPTIRSHPPPTTIFSSSSNVSGSNIFGLTSLTPASSSSASAFSSQPELNRYVLKVVGLYDFQAACLVGLNTSSLMNGRSYQVIAVQQEFLQIHANVTCDICKQAPLRGIRFRCRQCPNFDVCSSCLASDRFNHDPTHTLLEFTPGETALEALYNKTSSTKSTATFDFSQLLSKLKEVEPSTPQQQQQQQPQQPFYQLSLPQSQQQHQQQQPVLFPQFQPHPQPQQQQQQHQCHHLLHYHYL